MCSNILPNFIFFTTWLGVYFTYFSFPVSLTRLSAHDNGHLCQPHPLYTLCLKQAWQTGGSEWLYTEWVNTEVGRGHLAVVQHCPRWRMKGSEWPAEDLVLLEMSHYWRDAKLSPWKAVAWFGDSPKYNKLLGVCGSKALRGVLHPPSLSFPKKPHIWSAGKSLVEPHSSLWGSLARKGDKVGKGRTIAKYWMGAGGVQVESKVQEGNNTGTQLGALPKIMLQGRKHLQFSEATSKPIERILLLRPLSLRTSMDTAFRFECSILFSISVHQGLQKRGLVKVVRVQWDQHSQMLLWKNVDGAIFSGASFGNMY